VEGLGSSVVDEAVVIRKPKALEPYPSLNIEPDHAPPEGIHPADDRQVHEETRLVSRSPTAYRSPFETGRVTLVTPEPKKLKEHLTSARRGLA
jgi:hypothetical protein